MKNVVLLGPPGAGKGTLAHRLQEEGFLHLSTGDVLRDEIARGTPLGLLAKTYMDRGELVPDEVILDIVRSFLGRQAAQQGFLFDGFPRTSSQATALAQIAQVDVVIYLDISKEEVVRRLSARRVCENCGANYNLITQPPKAAGQCDRCGGNLIQRSDDIPEVIAHRYDVYLRSSIPVVNYYEKQGVLVRVDASRSPERVYSDVIAALRNDCP